MKPSPPKSFLERIGKESSFHAAGTGPTWDLVTSVDCLIEHLIE